MSHWVINGRSGSNRPEHALAGRLCWTPYGDCDALASSRARICLAMVRRSPVPFSALRYSSPIADDLAFERFDGVLQVFHKLTHDGDRRWLIFDLDGDIAAHQSILPNLRPRKNAACKIRLTTGVAKLAWCVASLTPPLTNPGTARRRCR